MEEKERSPVRPTPGSKDYSGLVATSTYSANRAYDTKFQGLSNEEANALCEQHIGHAFNIADRYQGRGIERPELRAASLKNLVEASRTFDPKLGVPFWGFARHRVLGGVKDLFRPGKFAPDFQRKESTNAPILDDEGEETEKGALVIEERLPALLPDLSELTLKERTTIEARAADRTLQSIGNELEISAERVRQIETRATKKLRKRAIAGACIRDLLKRRSYRKPYFNSRNLEDKRLKLIRYPGRHYSKAEIEAYKPQECLLSPNVLPPLWAPPSSPPIPYYPTVEIKRDGRWCILKRPGEISEIEADARAIIGALQPNKYIRLPIPREPKPVAELECHRNEGLRQLNGVSYSYQPKPSKEAGHHRTHASQLAALRGNWPLRNPRGPYGGPAIHAWGRA